MQGCYSLWVYYLILNISYICMKKLYYKAFYKFFLSIKDVMSCYTHLYSLQQWLKNILPPTSNLYWKALLSKYKESNCIY